ncbi:glycosyltransferase WbsX family protein [Dissulfurimicrobium hydrothermale]|uniref:glycosyltransferase WbsX family protein n=1 Tax=Dissulfurimicrobium hydrothermale TaxID=1750598 RepID=UPI001EDB5844|nr:glycoside hydrolase family 99-like domain-containing protein [Dissulfurimicrobium hydrothermale]UKL13458.1 glycoside hydrolase family 99-like domain-containing protein [Dissulfurimicrobium hydrothermale]
MNDDNKVRPVVFYFPQFHAIPENDEWWGKGFTDWVNVKKARPQFKGHYQPRVPLGGRYYDQSKKDVIAWQIELARSYGLYGFCHYHYWFDGKQLLETPTNIFLESKELDFNFCLAWANETWSRRWDGRDHHILIQQTHIPDKDRWLAHFRYLIRAWSDERAIKIDGKPVFLIYRAHRIENIGEMFDFWREMAAREGLKGLYFIAIKQYEFPVPEVLKHFDAVVNFQPFEAVYSPDFPDKKIMQTGLVQRFRILPEKLLDILRSIRYFLFRSLTFYDYETVWRHILQEDFIECGLPVISGAFVDWDNTPRYGKRARIFLGASPERFEFYFKRLVERVAKRPVQERFIFINAWNEWAEGAYLEPDERYGYGYLKAVKRCLG